jgi:hypothetical protein
MKNMLIKKTDMKRKTIFFVMIIALAGLMGLQSCKKDKGPGFTEHWSFTAPEVVAPGNDSTIVLGTGVTTVDLTWISTNKSGDPVNADVYFGTSAKPLLYKAGNTTLTVASVPVIPGVTYYWYVIMRDINNVTTTGPTWSFYIYDPIAIFTGSYNADEPAESYSYTVTFTKVDETHIITHNYWNSGWDATFTLDLTANTYVLPHTSWAGGYSSDESGTINQATGEMVGTYTIYQYFGLPTQVVVETGTHTYTHNK